MMRQKKSAGGLGGQSGGRVDTLLGVLHLHCTTKPSGPQASARAPRFVAGARKVHKFRKTRAARRAAAPSLPADLVLWQGLRMLPITVHRGTIVRTALGTPPGQNSRLLGGGCLHLGKSHQLPTRRNGGV